MTAALFWAATLLPGLIAYNVPPSPTLYNQAAAMGLWGLAVASLGPGCTGDLRAVAARTGALQTALALVEKYSDANIDLIKVGLGPFAPYLLSRNLLTIISQHAKNMGVPVQIHAKARWEGG